MATWDKQIIYLSYDGLTDPLGQSQVLPYLIGLSAKGYRFIAITFEKERAYADQGKEIMALCQANHITWTPLRYHKKPPVLSTIYDLWVLGKTVSSILKKSKISIIHCRSYITSLVGLEVKRKANVKFIFDMRGFWADERVEGGLWNLNNPMYKIIYRYFKNKEKQFLNEADYIISLTENAKQEILSWPVNTGPIAVIPTCVDLELFNPHNIKNEDKGKLKNKLGIKPGDFVLLYLGSWGTWYLTNEMLDFFSKLKKHKTNAKFLIVSADKIDLQDFPLKESVIVTTAARHQVPLYISLADISVGFIKPAFSKKASSATKLGELMAMKIPVITNGGWGDVDNSVLYGQCIVLSSFLNNEEVALLLDRMASKEFQASMNEFPNRLSVSAGVESYHSVFKSLTS